MHETLRLRIQLLCFILIAEPLSLPTSVGATEIFAPTGAMANPREFPVAALLQDGQVLVLGGDTYYAARTAELYDRTTGRFTVTNQNASQKPPSVDHGQGIAVRLQNGKVLVAGPDSAELYDPATRTFTSTFGPMTTTRHFPAASLLPSGQVLIVGGNDKHGQPLNSAEIYDPATDGFTLSSISLGFARCCATATSLASGDVLIAGGKEGTVPVSDARIFDSTTGAITSVTSMSVPRSGATATLLANGKVLIAGGCGTSGTSLATTDLYDPSTGHFTSSTASNMAVARCYATATLLPTNQVLVAAGGSASAETYDPVSTHFTATQPMQSAHYAAIAAVLSNGEVLVAGGAVSSAEIYEEDDIFIGGFDP